MNSLVKIYLNNREIRYREWELFVKSDKEIFLRITYPSGKVYSCAASEYRIEPTTIKTEKLLYDIQKKTYKEIEYAEEVGNKYLIVRFPSTEKEYLYKKGSANLIKSTELLEGEIYTYFRKIAQERLDKAKGQEDILRAKSIVLQFEKILSCEETALNSFLSGKVKERTSKSTIIYPFGINETQMEAIHKAFASQVSIVEGPPGTGKTQTILNIIANIIINGKTCAIVSNNNEAVKNVYEKLEKKGLGFLIAKLGRREKREKFFRTLSYIKPEYKFNTVKAEKIDELFENIKEYLYCRNRLAQLVNTIYEIIIEKEYLQEWQKEHSYIQIDYLEKYSISIEKLVELSAYVKNISDKKLKLKDKWNLLVSYKIFKSKFLNSIEDRESFIFSLQYTYYEKMLHNFEKEKEECEKLLKQVNYEEMLATLTEKSMEYLYQYITQKMPKEISDFSIENYQTKFHEFINCFPIIGSSSHSLINSIGKGYLLDYVIIDEASQQDLVPGILCFGCAKNVIVVGDAKQLPHIPTPTDIEAPDEKFDCMKYSLLDSVDKVFGDTVPRTMLKEHYRCHPRIIQFCNKEFYDEKLIPMTVDNGENALSLIYTALGNHMRNYKNQREIESVLKANVDCGYLINEDVMDEYTIGFIAPYNNQVDLARQMMSSEVAKNTIHKFQGRECNEIIFSTVLDKKAISQRQLNFVDDAALVNVAVSRAINKFTLVTGKDFFKKNDKYIASLIRYIEYYGGSESVIDSPVISAFDLLYSEYDASLERLASKLNTKDSNFKSEQIVSALLREILVAEEFRQVKVHRQVYLKQLIKDDVVLYTERERTFMKNRASCDFVLYYRVGKNALAVIEVDGGSHDKPEQIERDELKNCILHKAGIPLLRVRTVDSEIKQKITVFLNNILNGGRTNEDS